jgi:hypothetical protein
VKTGCRGVLGLREKFGDAIFEALEIAEIGA